MPISALVPWFGSKRTLAPRIVAEGGPHKVYWDVFCGSLATLFAKPLCTMETVNDLHGDLINLARVVQDDTLAPRLFERMSRTAMHEDLMHDAAERYRARGNVPAPADPGSPDFQRAEDYLLCSWLGRNGVAGTQSYNQGFCVRYTANGGHSAKRFRSAVDSIPAWWDRLRNVTILNRNARGLLESIEDAPGTFLYLDPPYIEKGATYVHDFASATVDDAAGLWQGDIPMTHEELARLARRFKKTRVVVSYYDHPRVRRLYEGWTFVECPMRKSLVNQSSRNRTVAPSVAPELLIVNGPSYTTGEAAS